MRFGSFGREYDRLRDVLEQRVRDEDGVSGCRKREAAVVVTIDGVGTIENDGTNTEATIKERCHD